MDDFRLKIFVSAARTLSFTQCANENYISQPAVSKHIAELEKEFGCPLFERKGSRLTLTLAGETLLRHAEQICRKYNEATYEMSLLTEQSKGEIRLGASTSIAQYLLPTILAEFKARFPGMNISVVSGNSMQMENLLTCHAIDIGMVENAGRKKELHYERLMDDELVLVCDTQRKFANTDEMTLEQLQREPLVLRENGSGTLEVVERTLAEKGYRLANFNILMQLGSTEAIKSFIANADALAVVSVISIRKELKNGTLRIIDIPGVDMIRQFAFAQRQGEENKAIEKFKDFTKGFS